MSKVKSEIVSSNGMNTLPGEKFAKVTYTDESVVYYTVSKDTSEDKTYHKVNIPSRLNGHTVAKTEIVNADGHVFMEKIGPLGEGDKTMLVCLQEQVDGLEKDAAVVDATRFIQKEQEMERKLYQESSYRNLLDHECGCKCDRKCLADGAGKAPKFAVYKLQREQSDGASRSESKSGSSDDPSRSTSGSESAVTCAWPECKKKRRSPDNVYSEIHVIECRCDDKLPPHVHQIPVYFCTSKCERLWRRSPLNPLGESSPYKKVIVDPTHSATHLSCASCGKPEGSVKYKKCGRCLRVVYCSPVCQKSNWKTHKPDCKKGV